MMHDNIKLSCIIFRASRGRFSVLMWTILVASVGLALMLAGTLLNLWVSFRLSALRREGRELEKRGRELQAAIEANGAKLERLQRNIDATDEALRALQLALAPRRQAATDHFSIR